MIEDFKFDVTQESMEMYKSLKGEEQKESEAIADCSAADMLMGAMGAQALEPGAEQSAMQTGLKFCTNCGAKRRGNGRLCSECGASF